MTKFPDGNGPLDAELTKVIATVQGRTLRER